MKYAKLISTGQIEMAEEDGQREGQLLDCMLSSGYVESDIVITSVTDIEYDILITAQNESYRTYVDKRKDEYPEIGDQLDALYHAGVFPEDMAGQLKAVKDKYPKE